MIRVALIGPGRLGRTLARALPTDRYELGWVCASTWVSARKASRELRLGAPVKHLAETAEADCWVTTVPVERAACVLGRLAASVDLKGKRVLYVAAHDAPAIDRMLSDAGAHAAALFPMTLLLRAEQGFGGACCAISGSKTGVSFARRLVAHVGGSALAVEIEQLEKAAVARALLARALHAVVDCAADELTAAGASRRTASAAVESMAGVVVAEAVRAARFAQAGGSEDPDALRWVRELLDRDAAPPPLLGSRGARAASAGGR